MLQGIDPGSITGIAIVDNGKLLYCKQFKKDAAMMASSSIATAYKIKTVAIEQPRFGVLYDREWLNQGRQQPNTNFSDGKISIEDYKKMQSGCKSLKAGQIKLAQNIGQNIALTFQFAEKFKVMGIRVMLIHPKPGRKGKLGSTKWDRHTWSRVFNWESGRLPGSHARDAAILAYLNEDSPVQKIGEQNIRRVR